MERGYSINEKKDIIINYIKNNPRATHKDIKEKTKLHVGRVFRSLEEAFKLAGVKSPRTFKKKTKDEKKKIIIDYIRKNPSVGGHTIKKDTKINLLSVFKDTPSAFYAAGIPYPRNIDKRTREEKMNEIINLVKKNPLISTPEIASKTKTQPYHFFKNVNELYRKVGINPINGRKKWKLKKQQEIIKYIKKNPIATQRDINKICKTHVQLIFNKGIFEAYEKAGIKFPYERLKIYGIGIKKIRDRAKSFEEEIAVKLSGYGRVNRLVKTKRGFADIILERQDKRVIIEVKDYRNKEISISQINQLNKYLEDCNCNLGILICPNKPKKDSFLIDKNKIFILNKEELDKIPIIMSGSVV